MAQLVERHLAKVEIAGSSPVYRSLIPSDLSDGIFFEFLRSAPVRAGRGPPDLVRRLSLLNTIRFIGWYFFSSFSAPLRSPLFPTDMGWLCFGGGIAEEDVVQCSAVEGNQGPKVAAAFYGGSGCGGDRDQQQPDPESFGSEETGGQDEEEPIESQTVGKFHIGQ